MEIVLNDLKDINKKLSKLNRKDWFKIMNTNLNIGVIITRTMNTEIYFECEDKTRLYGHTQVNVRDLKYYVGLLIKQDSIWYMEYILVLMIHGLRTNDILIFKNGQKGIVLPPKDDYRGSLYYRLVKKNGELGVKKLHLYPNKEYKIERCIIN